MLEGRAVMPVSLPRKRELGANTGLTEPLLGMSMCNETALVASGIILCWLSMMRPGCKGKDSFLQQSPQLDEIHGPFLQAALGHEQHLGRYSPDGRRLCKSVEVVVYERCCSCVVFPNGASYFLLVVMLVTSSCSGREQPLVA